MICHADLVPERPGQGLGRHHQRVDREHRTTFAGQLAGVSLGCAYDDIGPDRTGVGLDPPGFDGGHLGPLDDLHAGVGDGPRQAVDEPERVDGAAVGGCGARPGYPEIRPIVVRLVGPEMAVVVVSEPEASVLVELLSEARDLRRRARDLEGAASLEHAGGRSCAGEPLDLGHGVVHRHLHASGR